VEPAEPLASGGTDSGAPVDAAVTVVGSAGSPVAGASVSAAPVEALPSALSGLARDEAARQLWHRYYAPLAGWVASLVNDRDAAHDIASEAFTRMMTRWGRVNDPKGFLYVTATNLARDLWRREQRDRRLNARLQMVTPVSTEPDDGSLRALVDKLDERMRTPVLLFYYADLPLAEVARALNKPEGTVKRTLSDARHVLHAWLETDV
jgi:RNA polymerase sigma-70 factor (ECF subfamily)